MKIEEKFLSLERGLRQNNSIVDIKVVEIVASDEFNGILHCRVYFWDNSSLNIYETVNTELGYPMRIIYAYTYIREDQCVFRYDNAPHHPEIISFPHHKHIEEGKLVPTEQPALQQVFNEIESYLK